MSEDRTQPPSKRRRQLAREQGQVVQSPELTAAVGWLAAVAILAFLADDLALGLTRLVHGSLTAPPGLTPDRALVVAQVRSLCATLVWPLGVILAGFAASALAVHQLQVRGLWATALIAPSPRRLWRSGMRLRLPLGSSVLSGRRSRRALWGRRRAGPYALAGSIY